MSKNTLSEALREIASGMDCDPHENILRRAANVLEKSLATSRDLVRSYNIEPSDSVDWDHINGAVELAIETLMLDEGKTEEQIKADYWPLVEEGK